MVPLRLAFLVPAVLFIITVRATDDRTFIVAVEGDPVTLSCPSDVTHWEFFQNQENPEKIIDSFTSTTEPYTNYFCTGIFSLDDGKSCREGITVNSTLGTPMTLQSIEMSDAGEYTCFYMAADQVIAEKKVDVTVLRDSPELYYQINGKSSSESERADETTAVTAGTNISVSCLYMYAGMTDPGARIAVKNELTDGEQVLKRSPKRAETEFLYEKEIWISADYVVQKDDDEIEIMCGLSEVSEGKFVVSKRFQGPASTEENDSDETEFSSNSVIITAVLLTIVSAVIAVAIIGVTRQQRKRRQRYNDQTRLLSQDACDLDNQSTSGHSFQNSRLTILQSTSGDTTTASLLPTYFYNDQKPSFHDSTPSSH